MPQSPTSGREQRRLTLDDVHVRATSGDEVKVRGHAAVWEKPAWIGPPKLGFSERFEKGAFKESINGGADVRYLFNHNPDAVLARTKSGTLRLGEDPTGLTVEADLAPTTVGRDLAVLMERGDVNQMSVGMQVLEDRWDEVEGGDGNLYERRTIIRAKLFDVSAVTYPAYEETDAGLREATLARELRDARGVDVERRDPKPAVYVPPDPPRTARIEILPDGDMRIHRADGTTVDLTGSVVGYSAASDSSGAQNASTANVMSSNWTITNNRVTDTRTAASSPSPTPPDGGESPEGPVPNGASTPPGPATATPQQENTREPRQGGYALTEEERALFDLLQEHAFTAEHRKAPRLKCPACNRPATATNR
jgi:uncharacterized protein